MIKYVKVENNEDDIEQVSKLWKSEVRALGPLWKGDIESYIDDGSFYCIKDDNKIVAMCSYHVLKQRPEVRIEALVVTPEYRGKGYSKDLIYKCYKENNNLIDRLGYSFTAEAREGEPNNTFYDHISTEMIAKPKKTMVIRTYYLDVDKVRTWGPDKWATCPNPNGELGICYSFDRHGDRCGCVGCPLLDTLPNGMFNEGDPLPGLTNMLKESENETNS